MDSWGSALSVAGCHVTSAEPQHLKRQFLEEGEGLPLGRGTHFGAGA